MMSATSKCQTAIVLSFLLKLAQQKKLKEQVTHMKELCYHMEIEITGMRKKLLSCTNSSVVYTWKVVNKVVVETGKKKKKVFQ